MKGCADKGWEAVEAEGRVGVAFATTACGCDAGVRFVSIGGKSRSD